MANLITVMKICHKKNWSLVDWYALSELAQAFEIAWYQYQGGKHG